MNTSLTVAALGLCSVLLCSPAEGQTTFAPSLLAGTGKTYLDEPMMPALGADLRVGFTDRWAVRPSFLRLANDDWDDRSVMLLLEVALASGVGARPYLIAGAGHHSSRQKAINYTAGGGEVAGGLGVRINVGRRLFIAPEVRVGTHEFPVFVVGVGWRLP